MYCHCAWLTSINTKTETSQFKLQAPTQPFLGSSWEERYVTTVASKLLSRLSRAFKNVPFWRIQHLGGAYAAWTSSQSCRPSAARTVNRYQGTGVHQRILELEWDAGQALTGWTDLKKAKINITFHFAISIQDEVQGRGASREFSSKIWIRALDVVLTKWTDLRQELLTFKFSLYCQHIVKHKGGEKRITKED